ncbi:MAG: acetyl-CoA carboxylase biotin carboxyl carrier protein [Alphaproteobacteria bacterium]
MPRLKIDFGSELARELAEIMVENGLTEIELRHGDRNLRLSRQTGGSVVVAAPVPMAALAPQPAASPAPAEQPAAEDAGDPLAGAVPSPMVGTAYLASGPDADPFISVGDRVNEGDTLIIIEAMKVMNPIPAPRGGIVKAVLVEDAQPVEFGDPLVILE